MMGRSWYSVQSKSVLALLSGQNLSLLCLPMYDEISQLNTFAVLPEIARNEMFNHTHTSHKKLRMKFRNLLILFV